jgi:hypothetical protein
MTHIEKKLAAMTLAELDAVEKKINSRDDIAQWKKNEINEIIDAIRASYLEASAGDADC